VTMIENNIGGEAERGTDSAALATDYTSARATKIDNLDATISSRAAAGTCGNGVVEGGEGCDDGGTSWSSGACAGDCTTRNYWFKPMIALKSVSFDQVSAHAFCNEMGFMRMESYASDVSGNNRTTYVMSATQGASGWILVQSTMSLYSVYCTNL